MDASNRDRARVAVRRFFITLICVLALAGCKGLQTNQAVMDETEHTLTCAKPAYVVKLADNVIVLENGSKKWDFKYTSEYRNWYYIGNSESIVFNVVKYTGGVQQVDYFYSDAETLKKMNFFTVGEVVAGGHTWVRFVGSHQHKGKWFLHTGYARRVGIYFLMICRYGHWDHHRDVIERIRTTRELTDEQKHMIEEEFERTDSVFEIIR